ncbi:MAG: hypothetical protein J6A25_11545 [Lachnospiraceae bacterium]|nr:hypothetical protein [Lachnospiraceae bacterium]
MNKFRYIFIVVMLGFLLGLCGCGKEDGVVMITTEEEETTKQEDTSSDIPAVQIEELTTEEASKEDATPEEKNITIEEIYAANSGDVLLQGSAGYSVNTIYYSDGTEVYSEFQYLGFDESGLYMQVYEDSEGYVEVLDSGNMCWYIVDNNQISTLIYPEEGMAAVMIDYSHNDMVMSNPASSGESIADIYRLDGDLVVETTYTSEFDELYTYQYVLDDSLRIMECNCYEGEELISYFWTTKDAVYNETEELTAIRDNSDKRLVTVSFPDGSGIEYIYQVPKQYPVKLKLFGSTAYKDEGYGSEWTEISPMSDGNYADENIYIKRNN